MVLEIIKNIETLQIKSSIATKDDIFIIKDLLDTAMEYKDRCVGLAAIQLGYPKRIFVVRNSETQFIPIVNPVVINKSSEKYTTTESCMSLDGEREVVRHNSITIIHDGKGGKKNKLVCKGLLAQIVQHELDHLNGVLI